MGRRLDLFCPEAAMRRMTLRCDSPPSCSTTGAGLVLARPVPDLAAQPHPVVTCSSMM
jgi:hypothetical protein